MPEWTSALIQYSPTECCITLSGPESSCYHEQSQQRQGVAAVSLMLPRYNPCLPIDITREVFLKQCEGRSSFQGYDVRAAETIGQYSKDFGTGRRPYRRVLPEMHVRVDVSVSRHADLLLILPRPTVFMCSTRATIGNYFANHW